MAITLGLVTVRVGGHVKMKIATDQDGHKAAMVEDHIRRHWPLTVKEAYDAVRKIGFGDDDTLLVMTRHELRFKGAGHANFSRSTFDQAEFNPFVKSGIPEYTEVIDL